MSAPPPAGAPPLRDLDQLLATMNPELQPATFVYVTLPSGAMPVVEADAVIATFREAEGLSLIIEEGAAQRAGLAGMFRCRQITLMVHSSLEAVGFLAVIAAELARAGNQLQRRRGLPPRSSVHPGRRRRPRDHDPAHPRDRSALSPRERRCRDYGWVSASCSRMSSICSSFFLPNSASSCS